VSYYWLKKLGILKDMTIRGVQECPPKLSDAELVKKYRNTLEEIRDIARASEGVEFYAMLVDKTLEER
tara:strand:+ start:9 stop:212 length:204 start_codon:yes stop_codon:yes gene_type:complete